MPLDWQSPLLSFDRPTQPQAGAPGYDQSVMGQKLADDDYPDDWTRPAPAPLDDGYPDDWFVPPSAQGAGFLNDWVGPIYDQADDGYPDDWIGPIYDQVDDDYPDNRVRPGQTHDGGYGSPISQPAATTFNSGNSLPIAGLPGTAPSGSSITDPNSDQSARRDNWAAIPPAFAQSSSSSLMSPVSYQTGTKPWWIPMGPGTGFEPWADHFIKGIQGLISYFRSRQSLGNSNGPGCDEEWDYARRKCAELLTQRDPPRGVTGGYRNVEDCARGLVSERCGGNPVSR